MQNQQVRAATVSKVEGGFKIVQKPGELGQGIMQYITLLVRESTLSNLSLNVKNFGTGIVKPGKTKGRGRPRILLPRTILLGSEDWSDSTFM